MIARTLRANGVCENRQVMMPGDSLPNSRNEIRSLDDVPSVAHLANRQQLLAKWCRAIAMAPFVIVLFEALVVFHDSGSLVAVVAVEATLVWGLAVVAYSFYLTFWGVKCPQCGSRFGSGAKCRSCALPRRSDDTLEA